jgi:hypothetical protein
MQLDLAIQLMREQPAPAIKDRDRALIAGGFDRQDAHQ